MRSPYDRFMLGFRLIALCGLLATVACAAPASVSPTTPAAATAAASKPASAASPARAPASPTTIPAAPTATVAPKPVAKIPALASFYPLQEIAQRVGGERVQVANLMAAGAEPHDLELTPRDLERLRQARLLVYIGAGFQPGLEKALKAVQAPNLTAIDVTQGMKLLEGSAEDEDEPGDAKDAAETRSDPHIWLDPVLLQDLVGKVRDALVRIDPEGRSQYEANARTYRDELKALDQEFRRGLQNCKRKEIVTSHAAFAYLANRYGLEQASIAGLSPEAEPTPQRLREIIKFAKEHDVRVIYFETLVDPKVATTIAREVGAQTMVLNPIEGLTPQEQAQGKGYRDLMRQNLANLRLGLGCS